MEDLATLRASLAADATEVLEAMGLVPIRQVYKAGAGGPPTPDIADYGPLLRSFGFEVLHEETEENHSGISYLLYRTAGGEYGFLAFGWGSCSGCDALRACKTWEEVEQLRRTLMRKIVWRADRGALWLWLVDEPIQTLQWHWGSKSFAAFLTAACREMFGVGEGVRDGQG